MTPPVDNEDTFLLFFHGLDSSSQTDKYTGIAREPKYCQTVDYRANFEDIFDIYEALIQEKMRKHPRVVLAGHSLGAWFANHFAHKYNLRALLIAPCICPNVTLAERIPALGHMKLSFPTSNSHQTHVMVEVDDECLDVAVATRTLVNLPDNWAVHYYEGGHHRIARQDELWYFVMELCDDPFVWIDTATFYGED